jgi:hypothetical protein
MLILLSAFLSTLGSMFRSRAGLELENLALRSTDDVVDVQDTPLLLRITG